MRSGSSRVGADGEKGSSERGLIPKGWSSVQELAYSQLLSAGVDDLPSRTASREALWSHPLLWMLAVMMLTFWLGLSGYFDPRWDSFRLPDEVLMLEANGTIYDVVIVLLVVNAGALPTGIRIIFTTRSFGLAMAAMGEFIWIASSFSIRLDFGSGYGHRWSEVRARFVRRFGTVMLIPAIALVPVLIRAKLSYRAVTVWGVRDTTGWGVVELPWSSARSITVGCLDGHPSYRVTLSNERVYHLLREDGQGLGVVDSVDRALLASGVAKTADEKGLERCISKWPFVSEREQLKMILGRFH